MPDRSIGSNMPLTSGALASRRVGRPGADLTPCGAAGAVEAFLRLALTTRLRAYFSAAFGHHAPSTQPCVKIDSTVERVRESRCLNVAYSALHGAEARGTEQTPHDQSAARGLQPGAARLLLRR